VSFSQLSGVSPLDWYPKAFQPGDMDSTGGERLLGRTSLSPLEILIRETAQNSWDARLDNRRPAYGIHLRRIDWRLRSDLSELLPDRTRVSAGLHVPENPFVLEIFDRGTCGLDGPVTLRPVHGDAPRNYQDLILKLGVPRDDGKGGGTYGFGKTASFAFSGRGTVIYWTRCLNEEGRLEHRLIASAFRDSYVEGGVQFTGRHWWGRQDGETILPLLGEEAENLGTQLFARHFAPGETGTSVLIIDPVLTAESLGTETEEESAVLDLAVLPEVFASKARTALRVHLWPKLVPFPGKNHAPMDISLRVPDRDVPLCDDQPGALALWGAGLNAIRAMRGGRLEPVTTPYGVPVEVVTVTRNRDTLGHLAIVRRFPGSESRRDRDDLDPICNSSMSRIALMRGQPELIVSTVDWFDQAPLEGVDWLAVYKSADEYDAAYARTEPPAHDAWIASAGGEDGLIVKLTKRKIVKAIRDLVYPAPDEVAPSSREVRTGSLSRRFAGLLPVRHESPRVAATAGGGRRTRSGPRAPRVDAASPRLITTLDDGRQRQRIDFVVSGEASKYIVTIDVALIGDDGVNEPMVIEDLELEWIGADVRESIGAVVTRDEPASVELTGAARRAMRIDLSAEAADDDR